MTDYNDQRPPFPGAQPAQPEGAAQASSNSAQQGFSQQATGRQVGYGAQQVGTQQVHDPAQDAATQQGYAATQGGATQSYGPAYGYSPTAQMPSAGAAQGTGAAQGAAQSAAGTGASTSAGQASPDATATAPHVAPAQPGAPAPKPQKPKHTHHGAKVFLAGLAGGVIGAGALAGVLVAAGVVGHPTTVTTQGSSQSITINPSDESATLANAVAAKSLPSVVSITVTTSDGAGVGSGVILDASGNILTNYHVVDGAQSISVSAGGNSYDATVVGSDESSDLAVIKIDPGSDTLTPIEVGDSSALEVGDWVMSIGSPFGLEQSVSTGIVSSLYRSTMLQGTTGNTIYTNLIQTDAAINPGNSGGALVDSEGKLVGINSIIESASGSSSGVGFAIPGNYAVEVAQKIINGETVTHAYLGGSFQTVTAQNARRNNLSVNQGAYVAEVTSGSPAEQAGIQQGDIITAIDGDEITSSDGVVLAVRSHNVGDTVSVTLMRGTREMTVQVTLSSDEALQARRQNDSSSQGSLLDQYLNQYGYGNGSNGGSNGSDSYGYGNGYGRGGSYGTDSGSAGTDGSGSMQG